MSGYRALDMLIKQHAPEVKGRKPYLRPPVPKVYREVWVPAWNWHLPIPDGVERLAVLDVNAAYLAAASSVEVAHGQLTHTAARVFDRRSPGYWLIRPPAWNDSRLMHPLGTRKLPGLLWVTTPTITLLADLEHEGFLELGSIIDSYTSEERCRLRAWTDHVKADRAEAIDAGNTDRLAEIKQGYSSAVTILGNEVGCAAFRPDWSQHIRAQHAATMWRRAWAIVRTGTPVYGAGTVDELVIDHTTARQFWAARDHRPAPPIRIDQTGITLGTVKVKDVIARGDEGWPA